MRTGIFLLLFGLLAARALAQSGAWHRYDEVQPLDRLLPEIRRSHPGKFYDAEGPSRGADGQLHYHLKWLTPDGRLVWFDADARTGRVLGVMERHGGPDFDRGPPPFSDSWPQGERRHSDNFGGGGYGDHGDGGHRGGGRGGHGRHGW